MSNKKKKSDNKEFVPSSVRSIVNNSHKIIAQTYITIKSTHTIDELSYDRFRDAVEQYNWYCEMFPAVKNFALSKWIEELDTMEVEITPNMM